MGPERKLSKIGMPYIYGYCYVHGPIAYVLYGYLETPILNAGIERIFSWLKPVKQIYKIDGMTKVYSQSLKPRSSS